MDEGGVSSTLAFLFAGALFMASVGAVLITTDGVRRDTGGDLQSSALYANEAQALVSFLLESPGYAKIGTQPSQDWYGDKSADGQPEPEDRIERLGLLKAGSRELDFSKFENLRLAPYAALDDGYANYEEVVAAMGLKDRGLDFHIRAHPSLRSVQEILDTGVKDDNLRVAYIGDAISSSQAQVLSANHAPPMTDPTCILSPLDSRSIRIGFTVTNDGPATTAFHAAFDVAFGATTVRDTQRGPVIQSADPDESATIFVDLPTKYGGCQAVTKVTLTLLDPSATVATKNVDAPGWGAVGHTAAAKWFRVDPHREVYLTSENVQVAYDGELQYEQGGTDGEQISLVVKDSGGVVKHTHTLKVPKKNDPWVFPGFAASSLGPAGVYDVTLVRANGETASDRIVTVASSPSNYVPPGGSTGGPTTYTYSDGAKIEAAFLEDLVYRFCPYEWDTPTAAGSERTPIPVTWTPGTWTGRCDSGAYPPHSSDKAALGHYGDIFPDDKKLLGNQLGKRLAPTGTASLSLVNTLVVGSNVDHNTMTSNAVKGAIRDWVVEAGGTLIVFGSEKQVVNWLNPIFKTKLDTSSGPLSAPDVGHPILHVADDLSWNDYDDHDRAWDLKQDDGSNAAFMKVVHDDSTEKNSILAVSNPGAYGKGTVILTSWLPYDLFNDGSGREGHAFVNNLLMQGYRGLFLDYGPPIPEGMQAVPAAARGQVFHPELETLVALTIEVFVFPRV